MAGLLTYKLLGPDRRMFLPGQTTAGHYQIELACNACHTPGMGVRESACYDCHAGELKAANDSHPKNKFTDPRNADRLKLIQADNCVTCHREHLPEQTRAMGVTMPDDYCYHCHQQTLQDRPSHKDFAFNSCATAGCHNFHDNTALYESFLLKHAGQPETKDPARVPMRGLGSTGNLPVPSGNPPDGTGMTSQRSETSSFSNVAPVPPGKLPGGVGESPALPRQRRALTMEQQDAPASVTADSQLLHDWATTAHAKAGVNCTDCHLVEDPSHELLQSKTLSRQVKAKRWSDKLDYAACTPCHQDEVNGFLAGKHGMRLAQALTPMKPALARLPMKSQAAHRELSCTSCHGAHNFDTRKAAVESCLTCHNDEHSLAYKDSAHFALWQDEVSGKASAGSGVSCATCHLPREVHKSGDPTRVLVQHNQNYNLRPNEKMIRSVCLDCHGLAFSLDALADAALVQTNFIGRPARHVESIDLALSRQMELRKSKPNP